MNSVKSILIVDDDDDDVKLLIEAAQQIHTTIICTTCHTVTQALEYLKTTDVKPDFIFVDFYMPSVDGVEFIKIIQSNPNLADIRIVMLTGTNSKNIKDRMAGINVHKVLIKPSSFSTLCELLKEILIT